MYLQDAENLLPTPLRDSKLPWTSLFDDQAPAPRPGDAWRAQIGHFRFCLAVDTFPEELPCPLTYHLHLYNTLLHYEKSSWTPNTLHDAAIISDSIHQLMLESLLSALQPAQRTLHDPA